MLKPGRPPMSMVSAPGMSLAEPGNVYAMTSTLLPLSATPLHWQKSAAPAGGSYVPGMAADRSSVVSTPHRPASWAAAGEPATTDNDTTRDAARAACRNLVRALILKILRLPRSNRRLGGAG